MASSASDLLLIEKMATGENDNTWGTKLNTALSRLEEAIADVTNISVTVSDYTLDDTQYSEHDDGANTSESHVAAIKATGTLTGNRSVIVPARNKIYWVWNGTSGAFTLTIKTSGGTGVTVPQGYLAAVLCDGTNVEALTMPVSADGDLNINGRSILDTNGNELVKFTETASAVNEVTVDNAATGNAPAVKATGDDANIDLELTSKGTGTVKANGTTVALAGKQMLPVPASAMYTRTTSGAATGTAETTTNQVMIQTFDFDAAADEFVQFSFPAPKSWNESTVTAKFVWSHPATTTNFDVVWGIQGLALGDSDALDTAFGTAQTVTDTGGTTDDIFTSSETSAVTLAGTPAEGDLLIFQIYRDADNGSDTLAVDARLHAVHLFLTTDAGNDA